jgi:hypothetical protein
MGCVDGAGSGGSGSSAAGIAAAPGASRSTTREVEAPEIFQATDSALWDGRPSLGGIWVASPDVTNPERVVMVNPATGKTVTGALFRRERENPGPKLQISSDAAEALGILAGQPTTLRVTALRKQEVAAPATEPAAAPATPAGEAAETAARATAALQAAATTAPPAGPPSADSTGTPTDVAAAPAEPKRKTWRERRAEAKAQREAEKAAAAAAAGGGEIVDPAAGSFASIETAPLDARPASPAAQPAPAAAAVAATPAAPAAGTSGRPIQIASFSKEDNARRATEALAKAGITAQAQKSDRNGTPVWGVVAFGDAALLAKIKAAGFADAYFLK